MAYFLLGHSVQVGFVMKVNLLLTIGTVRVFPMTYTMTENAIQVCRWSQKLQYNNATILGWYIILNQTKPIK